MIPWPGRRSLLPGLLLVALLLSLAPSGAAAARSAAYTTAAHAAANPVAAGSTADIVAAVISKATVTVLVDVEVYDQWGNKLFQRFFDNQKLAAGVAREYAVAWPVEPDRPAGTYTIKIGIFKPGWGRLYHWNDEAFQVEVTAAHPPAPQPPAQPAPPPTSPTELPKHFGLGLSAHPSENGIYGWMPDSKIPWDYAYQYLAGGVNTGWGWSTWNEQAQFPLWYAQGASENGYVPVFSYYQLLQSNGGCNWCEEAQKDLSNLNNPTVMAQYYQDFALLMKRLGTGTYEGVKGFGGTAIVHVEPDLSGYAMHAVLRGDRCFGHCTGEGNDPSLLKASVASSGVAEVAGFPDTWQGFNQALLHLRDLYAPNVLMAFHVSNWATLYDISSDKSTWLDAAGLGQEAGLFAAASGDYDLIFNDVSDRDAGYYQTVWGRDTWWDRQNVSFPNFHRWEAYLGAVVQAAGKPAIVWQIPIGNQHFRTMDNTPGHYQDNRVEYFLSHVEELADVGIIGLLFGAGNGDTTTQADSRGDGVTNGARLCNSLGLSEGQVCNDMVATYADDDGGYLRMMADRYYATPLPLP